MGFKYVLIPADTNYPMQELEHEAVNDLQNDTFRPFLEKYYRGLGGSVDRTVLLKQLQERTGMDLEEKAKDMPSGALDQLLQSSSVEIFPVMVPTKDNGFQAISMYCDDKGIAKDLPENPRASGLVQSCGYPSGQVFRGDVFIGKVFDDTEDEWRREDLTLKDCSTDSDWVAACKKQRANKSSSDMASLASKIGSQNAVNVNPAQLEDAAPKGETEEYTWRQTSDEVEVTFKKDGLQKSDVKLVKVAFSRLKLRVEIKGDVVLDSGLSNAVTPDECTWTVSDGTLQVNLAKASEESWPQLLKA